MDCIRAPNKSGELCLMRDFVVVKSLVASIILGINFLHVNAMVLDFAIVPVSVSLPQSQESQVNPELLSVYESACKAKAEVCAVAATEHPHIGIVDEHAVPMFGRSASCELSQCQK